MIKIPMQDGKIAMQGAMIRAGNAGCCCECEMPEQITLGLSGVPALFARSVGEAFGGFVHPGRGILVDCGISSVAHVEVCFWPTATNAGDCYLPGVMFTQDCNVVLDLTSSTPCEEYIYTGYMPQPPHINYDFDRVCGGDLTQPVTVRVARVCDQFTVEISPPTKDPEAASQATATATASIDNSEIIGVTLTSGGGGYAIPVMKSAQPAITISLDGGDGSGATAIATLASLGPSASCEPFGFELWTITSFVITNRGSGYTVPPTVNYSLGTGGHVCGEPYGFTAILGEDGGIDSISIDFDYGGEFIGEELDYVDADSPTVSFGSLFGTGAAATAVVDDEYGSPTFGQVVALNLTSGGSDYGIAEEAWMLTITIEHFNPFPDASIGISHQDTLYGSEADQQCLTLISNRVTRDKCPNALIDKEYDMILTWPGGCLYIDGNQSLIHNQQDCYIGQKGASIGTCSGVVNACEEFTITPYPGGPTYTTILGPIAGVACTIAPA